MAGHAVEIKFGKIFSSVSLGTDACIGDLRREVSVPRGRCAPDLDRLGPAKRPRPHTCDRPSLQIEAVTDVPAASQKLLGLPRGSSDSTAFSTIAGRVKRVTVVGATRARATAAAAGITERAASPEPKRVAMEATQEAAAAGASAHAPAGAASSPRGAASAGADVRSPPLSQADAAALVAASPGSAAVLAAPSRPWTVVLDVDGVLTE